REVAAGQAVAVPGHPELAAEVEELLERQRHLVAWAGHADQRAGAGEVAAPERLEQRVGATDRLERVVDAVAAGDLFDPRDRVTRARIHDVRRAELLGPAQLPRVDVDTDDRRGACQARALDDAGADAAAAEDGDARAGLDVGGAQHRADARHHAAADQAHLLGRQLLRHRHCLLRGDDGVGAEGADAEHRLEQRAVLAVHALLGVQAGGTQVRLAPPAEAAVAARRPPGQDDVVADGWRRHAWTDLLDDARALVPEQEREPWPGPHLHVQVGVAHAARADAHEHLARSGVVDRHLLEP